MSSKNIGETIKKYRTMVGYTQAELADGLSELAGKTVAPSAITGYENGQRIPKVEVREQIAHILNVDPVEMSGLELTEVDEKRLICKLVKKYAEGIELQPDGKVTVTLSSDFADFQIEYQEIRERLAFNLEGSEKESLDYKIQKQAADDELDYWIERYPTYDAVTLAKRHSSKCDLEEIREMREFVKFEKEKDFFNFQDVYLIPLMNRNIMKKLRGK